MAPPRPATVVVVESCAAVQELIEQALRDHGHRVLVTGNRDEPAAVGWRIRIDLLLGFDEFEVRSAAKLLRTVQPNVQVLSLSPPVSLEELERAVADALEGAD